MQLQTMIKLSAVKSALAVLALAGFMTMAQAANDKDKDKNKLKFEVLQNLSSDDCLYAGEVVLDARYKLHQAESGLLTIENTTDGTTFSTVQTRELDGRRGSLILTFDAGECSKDVRISLEAD